MRHEDLALVLLDLMMPEMDGFEVLQVMREQESTRSIPVIVLSAQILTSHDMQRLQEGVAAVLGKGLFSVDEVLRQVETALNHSKRLGSQASRSVRQAMAYIHEHYTEPVSRHMLAEHVSLTERYLTYCFRQELGITPTTYLNRYRVKRAMAAAAPGQAIHYRGGAGSGLLREQLFQPRFPAGTGESRRGITSAAQANPAPTLNRPIIQKQVPIVQDVFHAQTMPNEKGLNSAISHPATAHAPERSTLVLDR